MGYIKLVQNSLNSSYEIRSRTLEASNKIRRITIAVKQLRTESFVYVKKIHPENTRLENLRELITGSFPIARIVIPRAR